MDIEQISSENLNKELAYLFGVYLTDGCISYQESYCFSLSSIDKEFTENTLNFFKKIHPECNGNVNLLKGIDRYWEDGRVSKCQDQYRIKVGFAKYGEFFKEQTGNKHHIPYLIWEAPLIIKKWFIAGVMDGDGWISKTERSNYHGIYQYRIGVCKTEESWIYEFKELLNKMKIQTCKPERMTNNRKKIIVRFSIKTESFAEHGLFFTIKRKQDRLKEYIRKRTET